MIDRRSLRRIVSADQNRDNEATETARDLGKKKVR